MDLHLAPAFTEGGTAVGVNSPPWGGQREVPLQGVGWEYSDSSGFVIAGQRPLWTGSPEAIVGLLEVSSTDGCWQRFGRGRWGGTCETSGAEGYVLVFTELFGSVDRTLNLA